jgi:DNA-binding response OmpR family regulator
VPDATPRRRLLVVEDDPDIAYLYRLTLEPSYEVRVAERVLTARLALCTWQPELLLLDIWLPDGSGLDLCREVKAMTPRLPILIVSADRDARRAAQACGADSFLPKPVEPDDIEAALGRLTRAA